MDNLHSCNTCYFYRAHYAKDDNGILTELPIGHCTNKSMGVMPFKKTFQQGLSCRVWLEKEITPNIAELNTEILFRLEQIENALKNK